MAVRPKDALPRNVEILGQNKDSGEIPWREEPMGWDCLPAYLS